MINRKILLTGGSGQVGRELVHALMPLGELLSPSSSELDLRDLDALRAFLRREQPAVLVNATAYTAVDQAESVPTQADAINHLAPRVLGEAAARTGALLVHYSTDYVFDGRQANRPYHEGDTPAPTNVYGVTKLAGEEAIRASGCRHIILRTSWVYGPRGQNFLKTMLRLMTERESISVVDDQIGAPTPARLVAEATALVLHALGREPGIGEDRYGTYHLQTAGETSWYGFAIKILALLQESGYLGLRCQEVRPIATRDYPTSAFRPKNTRLDCRKLAAAFELSLPHWTVPLERCVREISHRQAKNDARAASSPALR